LDFEVDAKVKFGNDGQYAYEEALKDPNSFLLVIIPDARLFERGQNNPIDTMDYVANIGPGCMALAIKNDMQYNTLEELVADYKKKGKRIRLGGSGTGRTIAAKSIEYNFKIPVDQFNYKPGVQEIADLNNGDLDVLVIYPRSFSLANSQNANNIKTLKFVGKLTDAEVGPTKGLQNYNAVPVGAPMILFANKKMNPIIRQQMLDTLQSKKYADKAYNMMDTTYMPLATMVDRKALVKDIELYKQLFDFKL
jgi:tripartite-type tricarboxylate transporter receptor subunit TctC